MIYIAPHVPSSGIMKTQLSRTTGFPACRYEEYLEDVIDASEEFHEVSEVMSRHATLRATNVDLRQQQHRVTDLAEESRCCSALSVIDSTYTWTCHGFCQRRYTRVPLRVQSSPGRLSLLALASCHM